MITASTSAESPDTRSQVLIIAGPSPHDSGVASLLLQHNITLAFSATLVAPEGMPEVSPDLVVLNFDSLTTASPSKIREARRYGAPVLCTIPREESDNILMIEQLSADDYIIGPYELADLLCRVRILLSRESKCRGVPVIERRQHTRRSTDHSRQLPETGTLAPLLTIDDRKKHIVIEGREIRLTPKEYDLFCLLASESGRVFSNQEIIERNWSSAKRPSLLDVQQYIHLLRKKIESDPAAPQWIVTVPGFGYKLELPVEQ